MSTPIILKIVFDEGSSSPFIARLFMGLLELRDQLYLSGVNENQKAEMESYFNRQFHPMLEAAWATKDAAAEVISLVDSHAKSIEEGRAVRINGNQLSIFETIDKPLGQAIDKLLDQSVVAIKSGLQTILRDPLGLDIGFLFKRDTPFNNGIASLQANGEGDLGVYLQEVRENWSKDLIDLRVAHEHEGWTLEKITYHLDENNMLSVRIPMLATLPVNKFARYTANRVLFFIENIMAYAIQRKSSDTYLLYISEIPVENRDIEAPKRFRIAARGLINLKPWKIEYRDDLDFL